MSIPLSDDVKALIRGANFAHLATILADGSPQAAPVWVDLEGDRVLVATGEGSLKARNTKRDGRVAMRDNPDQRVVLVIEIERARFARLPFTHTPA
jgi:hypothetical protein